MKSALLILLALISMTVVYSQSFQVTVEDAPSVGFLSRDNGSHGFTADSNTFIGFYSIANDRGVYAQANAQFGMGSDFNVESGFQAVSNQQHGFYALLNTMNGFESRNNTSHGVFSVFNDENGIHATNNDGFGVYSAFNGSEDGYFEGDVHVNGTLSKAMGTFKIDHPLDPENKYLVHSFVESPEMMNVYNGNIITDSGGLAVVNMPDWFDVLNRDFRYQLTVIGVFAQAIIKEKLLDNHFVIQTNEPSVEVSWQITGVRQDPYAEQNRITTEVDKEEKYKGSYLHHKAYGKPFEKSQQYVNMGNLSQLEQARINQVKINYSSKSK